MHKVLMLNGSRFSCSMEEGSDAQWKKILMLYGRRFVMLNGSRF
jgi:hypothetical protein